MKNLENIFRERSSGLFLLILAVLIITGVSLNSPKAESRNDQNLESETQAFNENQVLGETSILDEVVEEDNSSLQETQETNKEANQEERQEIKQKTEKEKDNKEAIIGREKKAYKDLNNRLDKYCHRSGSDNKKKCKESCLETKKASKKDDSYGDLYEKYCKIETTIVIENKNGKIIARYNNYRYTSDKDVTVLDFMKMASVDEKFSFKYENYSFGAYIYEINGIGTRDYNGYYWRLIVNGKSSEVGASNCEVSDGDKIEWEYTDEY